MTVNISTLSATTSAQALLSGQVDMLEQSTMTKAAELDPKRFFDNTLIRDVNRDYVSRLYPGQVKY